MKIAQIAPLIECVPPRLYGGTERIVSYLTEALVAQGHDVTLFASGQSITSATLVPCCAQALRLNPSVSDPIPYYMLMLDKVRKMASPGDGAILMQGTVLVVLGRTHPAPSPPPLRVIYSGYDAVEGACKDALHFQVRYPWYACSDVTDDPGCIGK